MAVQWLGDAGLTLEYSTKRDSRGWEKDETVDKCRVCQDKFHVANRKHHCRRCGRIVCNKCSSQEAQFPHFDEPKRCCRACFLEIERFRSFKSEIAPYLTANLACVRSSTQFLAYRAGRPPEPVEVWLSESLSSICWRLVDAKSDDIVAAPVHSLESVVEGICTPELQSRREEAGCCGKSENKAFVGKSQCLFSLLWKDGRSLDLEADNPNDRALWVKRFRLLLSAVPFAQWHHASGSYNQIEEKRTELARIQQLAGRRREVQNRQEKKTAAASKRASIRAKYQRVSNRDEYD